MTFDVIGHLTFAEPFDCLTSDSYHPWVNMIYGNIKYLAWVRALHRLAPGFVYVLTKVFPTRLQREHVAVMDMIEQKYLQRRKKNPEYTDFVTHLLKAEESGLLNSADVLSNLPLIVAAGSDTTASLMTGATFYILKYPPVYQRVTNEIRSQFKTHEEVTLRSIGKLRYLLAVLDESLRIYPPGTGSHRRVVPSGGATVCGRQIPGGTVVGINQYACYRSPHNFSQSDEFIPERWLTDSSNDKKDALQPFHVGPRNCLGRK